MGTSIRKTLLWIGLLALFFSVYTLWKIQRSESRLQHWIRTELAPTDTSAGVTVGNLTIDALEGLVSLEQLTYYSSVSQQLYRAESVTFTIGTKASIQMSLLSAGYVLNNLESSVVRVSKITDAYHDPVAESIVVNMTGSPLLLIPVFAQNTVPQRSLRINSRITDLNFNLLSTLYPAVGLFIPNDETTQFELDVFFNAEEGHVQFDTVRLEHDFFTVNVTGTVTPEPEQPWSLAPLSGQISVTHLSLEMQNLFDNFEFLFGIRVPRQQDSVRVGIIGTASKPQIVR
jgi:uncharacterized membrane protein YidH (DUF202 family)